MYWEEIIELIKTHGDEPLSTYPNQYNDSDEYEIYKYERGALSTSYIHIDEFSENYSFGALVNQQSHTFWTYIRTAFELILSLKTRYLQNLCSFRRYKSQGFIRR